MKRKILITLLIPIIWMIFATSALAQSDDPAPPDEPVKLIFIHHSVGENWLSDGDGDLGRTLAENNYFVSDTNYGWGPDSIGDVTDYYNWPDWFVGPESSRYMQAVYSESGQNSAYTRLFHDPGGENQIILFKSCFPNSDLSGSPNQAPSEGEWYTVGHAKYAYNQLLDYFITRPDKLFIAITPPPLLDSSNAENARQFSRWLVEDWLDDYPLNNVAVWDLHNTLTHPDNHHRFSNGVVEYAIDYGSGILFYDSDGDEHPNSSGNQKATVEFVPMLNTFYNRWKASAPAEPQPEQGAQTQPEAAEDATPETGVPLADPPSAFMGSTLIDDFESAHPENTNGWEAFWDEANPQTTLSCGVDSSQAQAGNASLRLDFHVEPESWATCALFYDPAPGFAGTRGLTFDYHAGSAALLFNIDAHGGTSDARTTYYYTIETVPESVTGWVHVELTWDQIVGVDWEATPGTPVDPAEINGFAIGFSTFPDTPNSGTIWIDNFSFLGEESEEAPPAAEPDQPAAPAAPAGPTRRLCPGSLALGLMMVAFAGVVRMQVTRSRSRRRSGMVSRCRC